MRGYLELAIGEQGLQAGAGLNKRFFSMFWQALDAALNFQSPASMTDPLFENQRQRAASPEIFCAAVALMFGKSALNICGDAGV